MSEDFSANKPLGTLATSQGEFLVFNITVGHQEHVRKDLGKPLDKSEPVDFATRTEEFNLAGGITENTYRHNLDSPEPQK